MHVFPCVAKPDVSGRHTHAHTHTHGGRWSSFSTYAPPEMPILSSQNRVYLQAENALFPSQKSLPLKLFINLQKSLSPRKLRWEGKRTRKRHVSTCVWFKQQVCLCVDLSPGRDDTWAVFTNSWRKKVLSVSLSLSVWSSLSVSASLCISLCVSLSLCLCPTLSLSLSLPVTVSFSVSLYLSLSLSGSVSLTCGCTQMDTTDLKSHCISGTEQPPSEFLIITTTKQTTSDCPFVLFLRIAGVCFPWVFYWAIVTHKAILTIF